MGLRELQIHASQTQASAASTSFPFGTSEFAGILCTRDPRATVFLEVALMMAIEVDRPTVIALKGVGINLAVHPSEALHLLQDGGIAELQAYEQHALQVISEQKVNNNQLVVQRDSTVQFVTDLTDKNH